MLECAIRLAEFVRGDKVRVLPLCSHGFHAACVEAWLLAVAFLAVDFGSSAAILTPAAGTRSYLVLAVHPLVRGDCCPQDQEAGWLEEVDGAVVLATELAPGFGKSSCSSTVGASCPSKHIHARCSERVHMGD